MVDGFVRVAPDGFGKKVDTITVNMGAGAIERQRVTIDNVPVQAGVWGYHAGAAGSVTVLAGQRVLGIAAHASVAGATMVINGGDSIPVPPGSLSVQPLGNITSGTIVFTGTDSYFVEYVT